MNKIIFNIAFIFYIFSSANCHARLKDLISVEGVRDNQLVGYGLVVGLAGDGDGTLDYTVNSIKNALRRFGVNVSSSTISPKNVAAVLVTADIGPFAKPGTRIDTTVSTMGDAKSLQGGVLLQCPLLGADGKVYAVAQGAIAVGGFIGGTEGEGGATVQQNHPTVGIISGGAIVEREIKASIVKDGVINLLLRNPDFTSAVRIADAINEKYPGIAKAEDSARVNVMLPNEYRLQATNFLASIGQVDVHPDVKASITMNERTGTIVATANVRISPVAVSHGSLTITIASNQNVSQPGAFAEAGDTEKTVSTQTDVEEVKGGFKVVDVEGLPTIERFSSALNALGVSTREMMSILQTIKTAGALQAELNLN